MKNKKLHTIISVYLALAIVFCGTPLSVNAHFCKGIPISVSFSGDAKNCIELSESQSSCCQTKSCKNLQTQNCSDTCCIDLAQIFYINADYQNNTTQKNDLQFNPIFEAFLAQTLQTPIHQNKLTLLNKDKTSYPILNKSDVAFIQSFLL